MAVFTDKFLKGLKPAAERYEERDAGCPGLIIRVNKRGVKVWEVMTAQNGRRRRIRLGTYPEISLHMARRMAAERKAAPGLYREQLKVRDLWAQYAAEHCDTMRSFRDVESVWQNWAEPLIGTVRLDDLSMRHGADLIEHVTRQSSPNRAGKVIRYLSPMLTFAAGRGMIPGNPWAGLHLPKGAEARDRVLRREEWAVLWEWSQANPYPWGPFVGVLMLTAQRLSDVARMRWDEIDGDLWTVPRDRYKSKRPHTVPLPERQLALINAQPRHDGFVFSTQPNTAIKPGSKLAQKIQRETETSDWRFHDLRRTAATYMTEAGVPRFTVERVLGHTDSSVTARYDRNTYRREKMEALAELARTVK